MEVVEGFGFSVESQLWFQYVLDFASINGMEVVCALDFRMIASECKDTCFGSSYPFPLEVGLPDRAGVWRGFVGRGVGGGSFPVTGEVYQEAFCIAAALFAPLRCDLEDWEEWEFLKLEEDNRPF